MKNEKSIKNQMKRSPRTRTTDKTRRLRRADFNIDDFVATADIPGFFKDFVNALPAARREIAENSKLCEAGTREVLLKNPIIALAQRTLSNGQPWDRAQVRKFISKDCSFANDIALIGYGISQGWLTQDMRFLIQEQHLKTTAPGHRLNSPIISIGTCGDPARWGWNEAHFEWDRIVDFCRERIRSAARLPIEELLMSTARGEVLGEVVASMKRDRVYWTIVKTMGIHEEGSNTRRLIDRVLRPVPGAVIKRLLNGLAPGVPGGWHASWALPASSETRQNDPEVRMIARGLGRLLGQSHLPKTLVNFSPYRVDGYTIPCKGNIR